MASLERELLNKTVLKKENSGSNDSKRDNLKKGKPEQGNK